MRPLILLLLTFGTLTSQAQTRTATLSGQCQSLLLRSATNITSLGVPADLLFTTYDGNTATPPLRQPITGGFLYSEELRPRGGGAYEMDYSVIKDADGSYLYYGSVVLTLPTTDSDGNGLPDVAQLNMAGTSSITGSYQRDFPAGATIPLTGSLTRNANSLTGTYDIVDLATGGSQVNVTGGLELQHYTGSISYTRGALNTVTFSCQRTNAGVIFSLTGSTNFTVVSTSQFTLPSFTLTNATDSSVYTVQAATFNRTGNRYVGALTFSDGDTRTAWADHLNWVFEFTDLNDADSNGIPDLTDALPSPPSITAQPQGQTLNVGASVSFSVTATGVAPLSYQWQKDGTNLPSATGTNYAIASVQTNHAGSYTVVVVNFGGSVTSSPALLVVNRQSQTITFGALSAKQVGNASFSLTATASSGLPISYSSSLPSVATVSGSTVTLVAAGTTSITASQPGDATYLPATNVSQTLLVHPATPVISSAATASAIVGQSFSYTITANNSPTGYGASGLPSGLTVSTASGIISGTPVAAGTNTVTLSATNAGGTGTKTLTLTVLPAAPVISSAATASGIISQPFTYQITASGSPSSFNATNLPAGLSVNTASGLISGTPTLLGTNAVALFATNAGGTGTGTVTLTIIATPPSITIQPQSQTVTNNGFNLPYLWVEVTGTGPLFFQWRLNGTNLPGQTWTNVSFTQLPQAGNYSVVVSNIAGSITSSVARVVLVPPPFSSGLTGWGLNDRSQTTPPNGLSNLVAVAAIAHRNLGLKDDGTVVAWGENVANTAPPPDGLSNIIALAAGYRHSLALKEDGTLTGWGSQSVPAGLSNVLAIAAGADHCMALKSDGTVAVWGLVYVFSNGTLVSTSPAPSPPAGLSNVVSIAAGWHHCLALRADGTVVGWGENDFGQATPPAGLSNVVAITGNTAHSLALRADGVVVGWGQDGAFGKATPPATLTNAIAIAAGSEHSLALRSDGTVVGWGYNGDGQITIPSGLSNVVQIAAGFNHSLALTGSKPGPRFTGASASTNSTFRLTAASFIRQTYVTESSTDFLTWLPISTNQPIGSFLLVTDLMPPGQARRFYRVLAP